MARKTTPLTTTQIKAARPGEKELTLHDGGGLYLLIKPSGAKIWRFSYYRPVDKKRALMSLGSLDEIPLAEARRLRNEYRSLIASGTDPQDHERRKREAEARRQGNTFENVAAAWYQMKISQNLAPNTIKDIWRSLDKYVFPFIGNTPIDTLTAHRFVEILTPIKERGNLETLKRVLQRVNEVMDYAANSGLIDSNPAMNVRKAFPSPVKKHMPTIRPEQLPELMLAVAGASIERQTRLLIEWQLLTVTRPAEASSARWEEIDLKSSTWTIPAGRMKMRRDHVIPLCDQAMAVLEAMKPISHHREYVFPGLKDPRQPMNSQTANVALRRMGFGGILVSHGMRAIFSTAANEEGFEPDVIEAALAHVDMNSVRRAYNRSNYLEKRIVLMRWWGEFVEAAATGVTLASGKRGIRAVQN
ncbi:TPA: integrase domain-containing protein [Escherichia coli]|nr:tyrosine-type recombinase/integrase [Escherichia coli]HDJ1038305.1 tyrosine-type recombinase/integrase [Escherichia coli]